MAKLNLVTGATGFIGSHVVQQLLEKGEKVRVLVRTPAKLADVGIDANHENLEVARGDLLDPATIGPALDGVDAIYHIAGFISTAPQDRKRVYELNFDITKNLFEACEKADVKKIVYLASIFALAGGEKTPATEESPYNLESLNVDYTKAKRQAELYAYDKAKAGMPLVFVYPCFCYGPGDVYNSSSRLVLAYIRKELPAYIPGGQNVMDVRDAAGGLILGMEKGKVGEHYIVGGKNLSYEEFFGELQQLTGMAPPKVKLPLFVGRWAGKLLEKTMKNTPLDEQAALMMGRYWYYDDARARRELGYSSRPLEETLRDSITWFCENKKARWPKDFQR
ncbi:MAG: SDR family oxidoreductase [Chrysiogenetes bacterium]|nr:SDR family oxidoreductase [Chrysiogenetes bacterium]